MDLIVIHKCLHLKWEDTAGPMMQPNAHLMVFLTVILLKTKFARHLKMQLFVLLKIKLIAYKIQDIIVIILTI